MDEWVQEMKEYERKREEKRLAFLNKCLNKLNNPSLAYRCLALRLGERFNLKSNSYGNFPDPVYSILNYWVDEVDEDFEKWINRDDGPFLRPANELNRIFPEFSFESDLRKKTELINTVYGLDLQYYHDGWASSYIYSYSFDFNSFKPIDIKKIHELKKELEILKKHGADTSKVEAELNEFNLPVDVLELI